MRINMEPPGAMTINSSQTLIRKNSPMLNNVLQELHATGLDTRTEYLSAIGTIFIDGVPDTKEHLINSVRRQKAIKKYSLINITKSGDDIVNIPDNELPHSKRVIVHFNTDAKEGILPENIDKIAIQRPDHGKRVPIRTVTLRAEPGEYLDLRIWITFMLKKEEIIDDKFFNLPDKFFDKLTARKLQNYEDKSFGGDPYIFPSRKNGCDHFINVYPIKTSRTGNEYRMLELGWRSTVKSGWKWNITVAGGSTEPSVTPWIMSSKAIRTWYIRKRNITVTNAVDQLGSKDLVNYERDFNDMDITPLIITSITDYIMNKDGSERLSINQTLFKQNNECMPAKCELCIYSRTADDYEFAGSDRMDGGLWSQGHPVIQRIACVIKNKFLDWSECHEINRGTQETGCTSVSRQGSQIWIDSRSKTFVGNGEDTFFNGLDYSTYWDSDRDTHLEDMDDQSYALDDPTAPWNDDIESNESGYDEFSWRGEDRLSEFYGTTMSYVKRGTEYDSVCGDNNTWISKKYESESTLTLGELTDEDEYIAKLDIFITIKNEYQDAYAWIKDQMGNNISHCNHFHGKSPGRITRAATPGYAALNKYKFGKLLNCKIKIINKRKKRNRTDVTGIPVLAPDMYCAFPDYDEL